LWLTVWWLLLLLLPGRWLCLVSIQLSFFFFINSSSSAPCRSLIILLGFPHCHNLYVTPQRIYNKPLCHFPRWKHFFFPFSIIFDWCLEAHSFIADPCAAAAAPAAHAWKRRWII
jgi:hypothetical protein